MIFSKLFFMFKHFPLLFIFSFVLALPLSAQIEGDNIFDDNQIITIELDFPQTGFYDSLVLNYATESYMSADLTLTDNTGTYTFENVGVRLKGNSSYSHPGTKKSFKIDFNEYVSGQNYDGLKKLNFNNGFKDPTMMREKIFYEICKAADVPTPRSNFANVYFNGTLWGFYTVVEQIDDQFLDWAILDDDGNLFKAGDNFGGGPGGGGNAADLLYYGAEQSAYEDKYELKTNEEENDWTDLIELIDFINNTSDTEFENNLGDHLELQEYLRSAALDNLFSNLDSYTNSARNYYLYHNLTTDKWQWIKWDGNESFGSYGGGGPGGGTDMTTLALDYHSVDRPLLENVFNSDVLYDQYLSEICYVSDNFFNPSYMNALIDEMKTLIQSSVYADGNKMYTNADFDTNINNNITSGGGPGGGTTYGLKSFVQAKSNFISGEVDCSILNDIVEINTNSIKIFPNPTSSSTTIQWENSDIQNLRLFNALGQNIHSENTSGKTQVELNVSNLESGIYFIMLYDENEGLLSKNHLIVL
jgi:spore coat protein CotH